MSSVEEPQACVPQNGTNVDAESLDPSLMSAETRRQIKLVDPIYSHDLRSGFQVGFLMFFVFLGAQSLSIVLLKLELTSLQIWNSVVFATVYVITQMVRRPSRIAWLRRKGRLSPSR